MGMVRQPDISPRTAKPRSDDDDHQTATKADSRSGYQSGHRAGMRAKLLDKGAAALSDLELLEMLLYAGNSRTDTKPLARN